MVTIATSPYSEEQRSELLAAYKAAENAEDRQEIVGQYAVQFGKSERSIIAVLSRAGVYVKPPKTDKTGKAIEKKDSKIARIAAIVGLAESDCEGLVFATKAVLDAILAKLPPAAEPVTE